MHSNLAAKQLHAHTLLAFVIHSVVTNSPSNYFNSTGNSVTFSLFKIVFQQSIGYNYLNGIYKYYLLLVDANFRMNCNTKIQIQSVHMAYAYTAILSCNPTD